MKTYEPEYKGIHTIRYTLQSGEYKGTFCTEIRGNCKGSSLLDSDIFETLCNDDIIQSDCALKYNEDYDCFDCVLHKGDGKELIIEGFDESDMANMLVGIEISDYQPE